MAIQSALQRGNNHKIKARKKSYSKALHKKIDKIKTGGIKAVI